MWRSTTILVLTLALVSGCSASRPLLVHPEPGANAKPLGPERHETSGYITRSGKRLAFRGYVETVGDTLHFVRPKIEARGLESEKPAVVRDIPRDSVMVIEEAYTDVPRSILFGAGIAALCLLFVGLSFAASFNIWR